MKKSKYVTIAERQNGDILVYSALTGAVIYVEKQKVSEFDLFCAGKIPRNDDSLIDSSYRQAINALKEAMIILDDQLDELRFLESRYNKAKYANMRQVALSISPTMKCNLACPYCYNPSAHRTTMDSKTRVDVINFVKDKLISRMDEFSILVVSWVGGEPLYDMKVLSELTRQIYEAACQQNCKLYAKLITNGTLLTEEIVARLKNPPFCVITVQVTFDGPPNIHNKTRAFKNGRSTFNVICKNIRQAKKYLDVPIRIGVPANFEPADFEILLDELLEQNVIKKNDKKQAIFIARISPCKSDQPFRDDAMPLAQFAELELECAKIARRMEVPFPINRWERITSMPCSQLQVDEYVIDVNGFISNCWESMDREDEAVGKVSSGLNYLSPEYLKWVTYNPFVSLDEKCKSCSVFPLCKGGCPRIAISNGSQCAVEKYNLKERLLFHYCGE